MFQSGKQHEHRASRYQIRVVVELGARTQTQNLPVTDTLTWPSRQHGSACHHHLADSRMSEALS